MYYECVDGVPEAKLCPDGLLFEDGNPNLEKCDYPFNVECGSREYVRELSICTSCFSNRPQLSTTCSAADETKSGLLIGLTFITHVFQRSRKKT